MEISSDGVVPLSEIPDWKVDDEDPDVRGWTVLGAGRHEIGRITDLMVDPRAERVRYLVVHTYERRARDVLVPIGVAQVDEDARQVIVPDLAQVDLDALPTYRREEFARDHEDRVRACFRHTCVQGRDYYDHAHFDDRIFFQRDRRRSGAA
jgi:hypothetical protein